MATKEYKRLVEEINQLRESLEAKDQEIDNLKMNNLFLETIFDGISEEIMVVDHEYNINDVNRAFLKRYGFRKSSVLGKKCYEIKHRSNTPCHSGDTTCPLERAQKTGERVEMTQFHQDAKGDTKEMFIIMYPLKSGRRSIKYFLEIARDLTEYRDLFRELQASEKRFRAILDTATDAILSIDEDHKIVLFNSAARRIFGYSNQEVLGKDLNILIPPRYGVHQRYVQRFLERRESDIVGKTISLMALRKGGEAFPIELSLSFLEMGGRITFTAIIRDVTEHRRMESKLLQSERLAAVGQAVAHVAHEIKNPLMIIGGVSNQIKRNLLQEKESQKLDIVIEEVRRLEGLVANLGDFTKEYRLVKRRVDINSVIRDVLKIMTGVYPVERYGFKERLSPYLGEIECDPDKLKQVFINIISNGLEAMSDGGTITVSTEKIWHGIEVRISDEGTGIQDEDLEHIFEPFYTTRERGSGLGLSISYKLIEAHAGEIWAAGHPGKGTTFVIRIPAK